MKKSIILFATLMAVCFSQGIHAQHTASYRKYVEVVEDNDPSKILDKISIYPPVFGTLPGGEGKRVKIKISNNGEKTLKKSFFYVYYKNKRVSKVLLPDLKQNGSYEFCVNIHGKMERNYKQYISFKIKRKKVFKTYKLSLPLGQKVY